MLEGKTIVYSKISEYSTQSLNHKITEQMLWLWAPYTTIENAQFRNLKG
jgi:hypothetical protein